MLSFETRRLEGKEQLQLKDMNLKLGVESNFQHQMATTNCSNDGFSLIQKAAVISLFQRRMLSLASQLILQEELETMFTLSVRL